jgi:large subunit ribosomal protein L22
MEAFAKAKFIRMSPRKVRLVTNLIVGLPIPAARTQLNFLNKAAAMPVLKALNSAVANAVNNFKLDEKSLKIKAATADQGPTLKRWRARAMGRAAPIRKRTTHITIIVTDGISGTSSVALSASEKKNTEVKKEAIPAEVKIEENKKVAKKTVNKTASNPKKADAQLDTKK